MTRGLSGYPLSGQEVMEPPNNPFAEGENSLNPQPTARNLTKPARTLRLGSSRLGVRLCIHVFRRLVEAGFAAQPTIENVGLHDNFLFSA
jgi:hypothetical protein